MAPGLLLADVELPPDLQILTSGRKFHRTLHPDLWDRRPTAPILPKSRSQMFEISAVSPGMGSTSSSQPWNKLTGVSRE